MLFSSYPTSVLKAPQDRYNSINKVSKVTSFVWSHTEILTFPPAVMCVLTGHVSSSCKVQESAGRKFGDFRKDKGGIMLLEPSVFVSVTQITGHGIKQLHCSDNSSSSLTLYDLTQVPKEQYQIRAVHTLTFDPVVRMRELHKPQCIFSLFLSVYLKLFPFDINTCSPTPVTH